MMDLQDGISHTLSLAYEMYLEHLRNGFFPKPQVDRHGDPVVEPKIQIRVLLDKYRVVRSIDAI